jgi:N-acetyl-anhydromuramyl-L-alanine amidase AmpD
MMDVVKYGDFKPTGKQKKKQQIILQHTSRNIEEYLLSLKYRFNGGYKKIPNYVISRDGKILQLLENESHSKIFSEENINRNSIIISLENLGWLEKEPLNNQYVNWIGDIYKGDAYEKKWRDYFFWQPYTETQIEYTAKLCKKILDETGIPSEVVEHNTRINGVEKFKGITSKSNFDSIYTDLSPAFNFETFLKYLNDEQFT